MATYDRIAQVPISAGPIRAYLDSIGNIVTLGETIVAFDYDVRRFGAQCNGVARYSVAATASATSTITVSDTGHRFTSADVGKVCGIIPYTDTGLTPRWGTISSVSSPTECVAALSGSPGAITGATFVYGTDDTTAVENALTAAKLVYGTVFVPSGITCLTRAIVVPSGVTLQGAGNFPTGGKAKDFRHFGANLVMLKSFATTDFVTLGDLGSSSPRGATLCNINVDCMNFVRTSVYGQGSRTNHIRDCTVVRGADSETINTGATGDFIRRVLCIPSTVLAGRVELIDGSSTFSVYPGNATLADLKPFVIEVGIASRSGAWKATVGTSMGIVATGRFT